MFPILQKIFAIFPYRYKYLKAKKLFSTRFSFRASLDIFFFLCNLQSCSLVALGVHEMRLSEHTRIVSCVLLSQLFVFVHSSCGVLFNLPGQQLGKRK